MTSTDRIAKERSMNAWFEQFQRIDTTTRTHEHTFDRDSWVVTETGLKRVPAGQTFPVPVFNFDTTTRTAPSHSIQLGPTAHPASALSRVIWFYAGAVLALSGGLDRLRSDYGPSGVLFVRQDWTTAATEPGTGYWGRFGIAIHEPTKRAS